MAYSELNNDIKRETTTHFHDLLHQQLSAENTRNTDHDSAEESGESPLDFSIKRKSKAYDEVSGSESLSSPASSFNDTGGNLEERKNDNELGNNNRRLSRDSPPSDGNSIYNNNIVKSEALQRQHSPVQERIGQPKTAEPGNGGLSFGLPNMINELQMGLSNANMFANSFPTMAALMDPRRLASASKGTRPFKAYPKDALKLNIGGTGMPSYLSSFSNFENSISSQGLNLSSEEIFSIYKQQLMALRERDKYLETLRLTQEQSSARTSSTVTSSSPISPLPTALSSVSMHFANRNNGINSNLIRDVTHDSSSSQSSPHTPVQTSLSSNHHSSGSAVSNVSSGSRRRPRTLPDEQKDEAYWERRRKNNDAAKRSRDARRAKEDEIAIRAALLEQENLKLRVEVAALKTETAKLRCMLYNS